MWVSAALIVASATRVLVVVAAVIGAAVGLVGLYYQWRMRRTEYRAKAAQAIELTRNIVRDLESLSRQREALDPAEIEDIGRRWLPVRDELVKFTGSQGKRMRDLGSGLASDIDESLRLIRRAVSAGTETERAEARLAFKGLVTENLEVVRRLRVMTGALTESARSS
jgi:hypothetical protein